MKNTSIWNNIRVVGIADKGKAIGKDENGRVVLIEDVVPGDIVQVKILRKKRNYWLGKPETFITYSDERVLPVCKHFGDCGGCKWQNLAYPAQLRHKEIVIRDAFERIAKIEQSDFLPIIGVENPFYCRNKLEYTFSNRKWIPRMDLPVESSDQIEYAAGFHPSGFFNKIVDVETCHLQGGDSNDIRNFIKHYCREQGLSLYDMITHKGWLRNVIIRNTKKGDQMVILAFAHEDETQRIRLLKALAETFSDLNSIFYVLNPNRNSDLSNLEFHLFYGPGYIVEIIGSLKYRIGPKSFFQTNSFQTKKLFDVIKDFASLEGDEIVWDLYSGIGAIALYLSDSCKWICGFEEIPEAIKFSVENAHLNGVNNARFYQGDVREILKQTSELQNIKPDVIITDPPRAGMHKEVLEQIVNMEPDRIIYVSCNPATQARDIGYVSCKYLLIKSQPVDMFPHTSHVENIALLKKR
jgi:23S rRNA (uracil1939-C5)-methyltransferase